MALISQGGGRVRTSAPGFFGRAGKSIKGALTPKPSPIRKATTSVSGPTKTSGPFTGSGYGAGGTVQDPFAFIKGLLTSTDPKAAQALIDKIYAPQRDLVNQQIAQSQALATARAQQMQDVYGALAQYMGGLQGNLEKIYSQGHADGSALTAGMSGPVGDVAGHMNVMTGAENAYNAAMAKAGGDLGASMPGVYSLMATQQVKQMLNAAGADQQQLRLKLLDLSSKEASDVLSYLENAQSKDAQLQEWAYGAKQSQVADLGKQNQAYLNYLQKQYELNWQHNYETGKLTLEQSKAQADATYKAQLLQLRQQGLIDTQTYQQGMLNVAQGKLTVAQKNAATSAKSASARAAASGPVGKAQAALLSTTQKMGKDIGSKRSKSGNANNATWITPDGKGFAHQIWYGGPGKYSDTPVKGWTKVAPSPGKQWSSQNLWTYAWKTYAPSLFSYYRALYPNIAKTPGGIQKLVEKRVAAAVGWHP
jgi:hypothetical protein